MAYYQEGEAFLLEEVAFDLVEMAFLLEVVAYFLVEAACFLEVVAAVLLLVVEASNQKVEVAAVGLFKVSACLIVVLHSIED